MAGTLDQAKQLLRTLVDDRDQDLLRIDKYVQGDQDDPYMPENADAEYKLLAERAITNVMGFIVGSSTQAMYVDSFRRGKSAEGIRVNLPADEDQDDATVQPEWDHWQRSRLDARQAAIYRGALIFGHSFTLTEKHKRKGLITTGLSALRTAALYEDPANDETPYVALTVTAWPKAAKDKKPAVPGKARMWDDTHEYAVTFENAETFVKGVTVEEVGTHGASECPITRFTAAVDLEGRTCGVVAPMIPLQNRINQSVFDMLIVQSYASFKVRTISGMAPPVKMKPVDVEGNEVINPVDNDDRIDNWVPRLDGSGNPIPENINLNARRVFWAEDEDTKFSTLDETPLEGFIEAIKLAFQHMAALSQTPPHHLLGQVANLSADALRAAESSLLRKVEEFRSSFGESWERVFRLAAQIGDFEIGESDHSGEVLWRDVNGENLAQAGDALGKLAESLGIPKRALWRRVPGVTSTELQTWKDMEDEDNVDRATARAARRATTSRPSYRSESPPSSEDEAA